MDKWYASVPHQRRVTIRKANSNRDNLYAIINICALGYAMTMLSHSALKLWLYFAKNQDGYTSWLSFVDVRNVTGLSIASYKRACSELITKTFLVETDKNCFDFYELPQST